jgi:nicotinate-nucleotide adenylyltransferase
MSQTSRDDRRIAFFGGSFDPPHLGHLAVARAAREALGLGRVLFAPVGAQPLKPVGAMASFEHRVAMTRLAIAGETGLEISLADAPKPSGAPNYTLKTLENLRREFGPDCALYCLMGADSLAGLRLWHRAAEIPFVATLIVASRPGEDLDDLKALLPGGLTLEEDAGASLHGAEGPVLQYSLLNDAGKRAPLYVLPGLDVEISASQIRDLARARARALGAGELLPAAVAEYIKMHGLYR